MFKCVKTNIRSLKARAPQTGTKHLPAFKCLVGIPAGCQFRGSCANDSRSVWNGHFPGFWARLNCEEMPVLPAWIVRRNVDDPRKIPYLLVWKRKGDGRIMEALRLSNFVACGKERNATWT